MKTVRELVIRLIGLMGDVDEKVFVRVVYRDINGNVTQYRQAPINYTKTICKGTVPAEVLCVVEWTDLQELKDND